MQLTDTSGPPSTTPPSGLGLAPELAACRCALALEQALEERLRHACHVAVVASAGFAVGSVALPAQRVPVLSGRSYATSVLFT